MTELRKTDSHDLLAESYREEFGEEPDDKALMVIRMFAKRVDNGESFEWLDDGNWRRLHLILPSREVKS